MGLFPIIGTVRRHIKQVMKRNEHKKSGIDLKMSFAFHPEAEDEFNDAIDHYMKKLHPVLDMILRWRCIQ